MENAEKPKKGKRKPGGKEANIDLEFAAECKRKREELGATIESFWKTLGVAKSTGSRCESGQRGVSEPIKMLYRTVYGGKAMNALEKYGENGKKFMQMLSDPAVAELAYKALILKRKQ